jgi:hypothetical protein
VITAVQFEAIEGAQHDGRKPTGELASRADISLVRDRGKGPATISTGQGDKHSYLTNAKLACNSGDVELPIVLSQYSGMGKLMGFLTYAWSVIAIDHALSLRFDCGANLSILLFTQIS